MFLLVAVGNATLFRDGKARKKLNMTMCRKNFHIKGMAVR
jgi:hypothetical protein